MIEHNIASVVRDGLCTGCGTCTSMCPELAIKMSMDEKRKLYIPEVNEEFCNKCKICLKVCPGLSVDFKMLNKDTFGKDPEDIILGNYLNCYFGHSKNYNIRYNSSSGGLITQLLIFALEEGVIDGALVTRMKKDNPLEPDPFIARTKEDIIDASKSKYCPVPANIALDKILNSEDEERFAIVGLPCHIHGVRKAAMVNKKLKQKVVLHIGLWCSTSCNFLGTEYILKRLGICKKNVKELYYRGKGWPGAMSIQLKGGKNKFIALADYWDTNFSSFAPSRCILCTDANAELADISFGDYRGRDAFLQEKLGNSGIISRAIIGDKILQKMLLEDKIEISQINCSDVAELQGYFHYKKKAEAIFHLFRLTGKKTPIYKQKLLKPSLITYLSGISIILRRRFADKRYLWFLMEIYNFIYDILIKIK